LPNKKALVCHMADQVLLFVRFLFYPAFLYPVVPFVFLAKGYNWV